MGTNVRLTRSGGFAGLSMVANVDLDELPHPAAAQVRAALEDLDFERLGKADRPRGGMPDAYQYDLEVDDGKRRAITVHEPVPSPHIQALVDVLLPLAKPE
jgi:hypothetical protein